MEIKALLSGFVQTYYLELMCLVPVTLMLAGLTCMVATDMHIQKRKRQTMLVLCALLFSLIAQNFTEYLLCVGRPNIPLRKALSVYGYAVRPVILLLFLQIIDPHSRHTWGWALIGLNAALYTASAFVPICFTIDAANIYHQGLPGLRHTCMIVSMILLGMLLVRSLRIFKPSGQKSALLPVMATLLIPLSLVPDNCVEYTAQPVSFLTVAVVIDCVLYYNWLHFQFVYEHEQAIAIGQRAQLMLSQIKPHFLYNVLNMIEELCDTSPQTAREATGLFAQYLRKNMNSIDQTGAIPFRNELDHTRLYVQIEQLRFEDALSVRYDIGCTDFSIPALTLEPLVENAIRHGVRRNAGGRGTVVIATRETPECFEVRVTDDGPGFDPATLPEDEKSHVGLRNVRERLAQVCGGTIAIESAPGRGTTATILLPKGGEGAGLC